MKKKELEKAIEKLDNMTNNHGGIEALARELLEHYVPIVNDAQLEDFLSLYCLLERLIEAHGKELGELYHLLNKAEDEANG